MDRRDLDDLRVVLLWTQSAVKGTIYKAQCRFDPDNPLRVDIEREQVRRLRRLKRLIEAIDAEIARQDREA